MTTEPNRVREAVERVRGHYDEHTRASHVEPSRDEMLLICTAAERAGELERELRHRKAMQPHDRDGRPITQAAANRLMGAYDELPKLRADLDELEAELAAARNLLDNTQDCAWVKLDAIRAIDPASVLKGEGQEEHWESVRDRRRQETEMQAGMARANQAITDAIESLDLSKRCLANSRVKWDQGLRESNQHVNHAVARLRWGLYDPR